MSAFASHRRRGRRWSVRARTPRPPCASRRAAAARGCPLTGAIPPSPSKPPAQHEAHQDRLRLIVQRVRRRPSASAPIRASRRAPPRALARPRPQLAPNPSSRPSRLDRQHGQGRPRAGRRAARTYAASVAESGRSPMIHDGTPRAGSGRVGATDQRSRARHTESGPPLTHTSTSWPGTNRSCARTVVVTRSITRRPPAVSAPPSALPRDAGDPAVRVADLAGLRRCSRASHTRLKPLMPTRSTTSRTKRSPASYCATFSIEADRALEPLLHAATRRRRAAERARSRGRVVDVLVRHLVHHDRRRGPSRSDIIAWVRSNRSRAAPGVQQPQASRRDLGAPFAASLGRADAVASDQLVRSSETVSRYSSTIAAEVRRAATAPPRTARDG